MRSTRYTTPLVFIAADGSVKSLDEAFLRQEYDVALAFLLPLYAGITIAEWIAGALVVLGAGGAFWIQSDDGSKIGPPGGFRSREQADAAKAELASSSGCSATPAATTTDAARKKEIQARLKALPKTVHPTGGRVPIRRIHNYFVEGHSSLEYA